MRHLPGAAVHERRASLRPHASHSAPRASVPTCKPPAPEGVGRPTTLGISGPSCQGHQRAVIAGSSGGHQGGPHPSIHQAASSSHIMPPGSRHQHHHVSWPMSHGLPGTAGACRGDMPGGGCMALTLPRATLRAQAGGAASTAHCTSCLSTPSQPHHAPPPSCLHPLCFPSWLLVPLCVTQAGLCRVATRRHSTPAAAGPAPGSATAAGQRLQSSAGKQAVCGRGLIPHK